jgi:3-deoxy-D-manno-octulosonic-acid transferase
VPAGRIRVTGDPVLDSPEEADPAAGRELRVQLGGRPLLFALGAAPDEPEMLAGLCQHLPGNFSGWLLVIEPADPAEGPALAERLARFDLAPARAAAGEAIARATRVYILDDPSPRDALLNAADWVILGGTWAQGNAAADPRPAAARGKGLLYGPYPHRHRTAIHALWEAGAARQAPSANHLLAAMSEWLSHPGEADRAGRAARELTAHHRGAAQAAADLLDHPPDFPSEHNPS